LAFEEAGILDFDDEYARRREVSVVEMMAVGRSHAFGLSPEMRPRGK
jgi:hypothetical protein